MNITTTQADITGNEIHNNDRGLYLQDNDATARTVLRGNRALDNKVEGFLLFDYVDAIENTAWANGTGIVMQRNVGGPDATPISANVTGIQAKDGQVLQKPCLRQR